MSEIEELRQENAELKKRLEVYENEKPIFARRLKRARQTAELTQKQIADKLGMATMTLSQYETGKREPNVSVLIKIADSLDISLDWLCGRTEKMTVE